MQLIEQSGAKAKCSKRRGDAWTLTDNGGHRITEQKITLEMSHYITSHHIDSSNHNPGVTTKNCTLIRSVATWGGPRVVFQAGSAAWRGVA